MAKPKRLRAAAMTAARLSRTSIQRRALARTSSARDPKKRKRASRPSDGLDPSPPADAGVEPGASERNTLDCWQAEDPDAKRAGLHLAKPGSKEEIRPAAEQSAHEKAPRIDDLGSVHSRAWTKTGEFGVENDKSGTGTRGRRSHARPPDAAGSRIPKPLMNSGAQKMGKKRVQTARRPVFSHSQVIGSTHSCRHLVGKCAGKGRKGRRRPGPATRRPHGRVRAEGRDEERRLSEPALRHPGAGRQVRVRDQASRQRGREDAAKGGQATANSGVAVS